MADSPTQPGQHADAAAIAADVHRVREDYADEEAEAAEHEAAENAAALDVSLSLRISRDLDEALKRRSTEEQISPSALARRPLRQALQAEDQPVRLGVATYAIPPTTIALGAALLGETPPLLVIVGGAISRAFPTPVDG